MSSSDRTRMLSAALHGLVYRSRRRWLEAGLVALTAVMFAACTDAATKLVKPAPANALLTCDLQDDPDPNCTPPDDPGGLPNDDAIFTYSMAFTYQDVSPTPDMPVWDGETNFSVEDSEARCPFNIPTNGMTFTYQGIRFFAPGPLLYTGSASRSTQYRTLPHGQYETMGQIISMDGRNELLGGVIVACNGTVYRVPRSGATVWRGNVIATGGFGSVRSTSRGPSGGTTGNQGWAWGGVTVTVESGVGDGWQDALEAYLTSGGSDCRIGWEIWVDGHQVCEADGTPP